MTAERSQRVSELYSGAFSALGEIMDIINYTTPLEQIEKLKKQNLTIENESEAIEALSLYGYSNLIKSYREPYTHVKNGLKVYRSGVSFKQVCSLYILDKNLRNAVMASMLDLEEYIKEAAADVVASSFGTREEDYLQFRNYQNKRKKKSRFTLKGILDTMNTSLKSEKDPIMHYRKEHGIVPPWILFKSLYFSTITNFIDQFKRKEKDEMVSKLYDTGDLELSMESYRKLMMDTLFICQEYRNLAAHGGRTYNHSCDKKLRIEEIFGSIENIPTSGFSQLLCLLQLLKYKTPYENLLDVLQGQVNRHCNEYPQDVTYLGQILNIDITPHKVVYVTQNSNKYHTSPYCSGI